MLMFRYDIWFLLHLMVSSESLLVSKSVKREEEKKKRYFFKRFVPVCVNPAVVSLWSLATVYWARHCCPFLSISLEVHLCVRVF